ncbi:MAG: hypothetical protein K6C05_02040 [Anaerovibrio sp.]|uniref:hypothetical protein n=1 Tax=Anaerovibrio sp. TaxID=1872532 RepID=UPI0025CEBF08|nr:hypothetical protein [Anaerovibrio sp.]MCR5175612.1 hypothetical protein [Anaerovibrio sp.]
MMKLRLGATALLSMLIMIFSTVALAAQPEDFSFKGLHLGDSVEQMKAILGEPDFDTEMFHRGVPVIRYTYSADQKIYVSASDKKVVEMFCKSKHYIGPHNVTYGATRSGITKAFGNAEHKQLNGSIYYIFYNPANRKNKMMLELETEKYYLLSWTYTSLDPEDDDVLLIMGDNEAEKKPEKRFNYGMLPS